MNVSVDSFIDGLGRCRGRFDDATNRPFFTSKLAVWGSRAASAVLEGRTSDAVDSKHLTDDELDGVMEVNIPRVSPVATAETRPPPIGPERFEWFWRTERFSAELVGLYEEILTQLSGLESNIALGNRKLTECEAQHRSLAGDRQEHEKRRTLIAAQLAPFLLTDDPLFRRLEPMTDAAIVQALTQNLKELGRLLENLDAAESELNSSPHPEAHIYRQRYETFRNNLCSSLQAIVTRTMEKAERTLTQQVEKSRRNLKISLVRRKYVNRLTRVAMPPGVAGRQPVEEEIPNDPFGLGGDENSSFLPARWFYIKYRAYGAHVIPIATLLHERARSTGIHVYRNTLDGLTGVYANIRLRFMSGAFKEQLQHLLGRHDAENTSLDIALRQITTFWLSIAHYEVDLYTGYFGPVTQASKTTLTLIIIRLGNDFYDVARRRVLACYDLEVIRDVFDALAIDVIDVRSASIATVSPLTQEIERHKLRPVRDLQKDLQERMVVRAEAFISNYIRPYPLTLDSLDYPKILQVAPMSGRVVLYHPLISDSIQSLMHMRSALQPAVLRMLAHELTISCLEKMNEAIALIIKNHNDDPLHGSMFGIRQLLHLKRRIGALNLDVSTSSRSLSFSRLRRGISAVFGEGSGREKPGLTGIFLSLIVPEVEESELDAREILQTRLDGLFDATISWAAIPIIKPMVDAAGNMGLNENSETWKVNCDKAVQTFWKTLRERMPLIANAIGLYLLNIDPAPETCRIVPFEEAVGLVEVSLPEKRHIPLKSNGAEPWESTPEEVAQMLLELIEVAVCEAYRQLLSICERNGHSPQNWPTTTTLIGELHKSLRHPRSHADPSLA